MTSFEDARDVPRHTMSMYANKDDMIRAVLAENESLHAEVEALRGGWRPIETAPRDGTWVMLWRTPESEHSPMRSEPMVIARWSDEYCEFVWTDEVCDLFTTWGQAAANSIVDEGCSIWRSDSFTHWKPLPTPPAQEDGNA